jgi:hypothetical protein
MYEAGEITREAYLAMTKERRVFDEAKAFEALRKEPETYLPIIAAMGERSNPSTSLFVRKAR